MWKQQKPASLHTLNLFTQNASLHTLNLFTLHAAVGVSSFLKNHKTIDNCAPVNGDTENHKQEDQMLKRSYLPFLQDFSAVFSDISFFMTL